MNKIIEVKGLKKSYGNVQAVKGIDFYVEEGALFSFLGPNGAGKSTTIDILCTLSSYDSGDIRIVGHDLKTSQNEIRSEIGVVFQDNLQDSSLSVKDNLMLRAGFYYKSKTDRQKAVDFAAKNSDVTAFMHRPYGKLSGGQRRRADIARALLNTPRLFFLDEPTTGLDPQTRLHVWDTVRRLQKENKMTVFLTTHYMEEAEKSDYVIIIDNGEIVAKGTPYDLKHTYCYDHLKVKCLPSEKASVIQYLQKASTSWKEEGELLDIALTDTKSSLSILNDISTWIESFEVIHGTMDDVFLNITGKEMREV